MPGCLAGLAGRRPKAAASALAELVRRHGLERASEVLSEWADRTRESGSSQVLQVITQRCKPRPTMPEATAHYWRGSTDLLAQVAALRSGLPLPPPVRSRCKSTGIVRSFRRFVTSRIS